MRKKMITYSKDFSGQDLLGCIKELLKVDKEWIPQIDGFSMYIRPTAISMTVSQILIL